MIHINGSNSYKKSLEDIAKKVMKNKLLKNKITLELIATFQIDLDSINNLWTNFMEYLKSIPKFDRLYLEGNSIRYKNPKVNYTDDGKMIECIDYLAKSGAVFEKTEIKIFGRLAKLDKKFQYFREFYVCRKINETLLDNERGVLLYGESHAGNLIKRISRMKNTSFEVYR